MVINATWFTVRVTSQTRRDSNQQNTYILGFIINNVWKIVKRSGAHPRRTTKRLDCPSPPQIKPASEKRQHEDIFHVKKLAIHIVIVKWWLLLLVLVISRKQLSISLYTIVIMIRVDIIIIYTLIILFHLMNNNSANNNIINNRKIYWSD